MFTFATPAKRKQMRKLPALFSWGSTEGQMFNGAKIVSRNCLAYYRLNSTTVALSILCEV